MISKTFTVNKNDGSDLQCYKGFNRSYQPVEMELVAITMTDGELDVWVLDDTREARMEFVRFVSEEEQATKIVGIYRRTK